MTTTPERTEPSTTAGERAMLEGWLEFHRETLERKCAGLTDEQLRTASVPPSDLSLLGLVRHMAEVERGWFRRTLAGEEAPPLYYDDADRDGDFHPAEEDTWEEARATWQAEITRARELAADRSLDDLAARTSRAGESYNLRWILTHMIEEYARHNGHADLLRECVDGSTGD
ncbi:DinB family protein [Streptomyces sp. HNM0663]|uniref:DinB family protein n=1 Tax=Streptomyces chengmaiensis TaxID=3040919 RepID=A0ABT6HN78_9ACTN|nr:DinB family protein [Streptomyces chengmaiensis]MDH2390143.1 DinB family protein [Streptomyces chengmaiensis]